MIRLGINNSYTSSSSIISFEYDINNSDHIITIIMDFDKHIFNELFFNIDNPLLLEIRGLYTKIFHNYYFLFDVNTFRFSFTIINSVSNIDDIISALDVYYISINNKYTLAAGNILHSVSSTIISPEYLRLETEVDYLEKKILKYYATKNSIGTMLLEKTNLEIKALYGNSYNELNLVTIHLDKTNNYITEILLKDDKISESYLKKYEEFKQFNEFTYTLNDM